jgi:hypothetical protein
LPKEIAQVIETGDIFRAELTPYKSFSCTKMSSFVKEHKDSLYKAIEMLVCKLAISVNVKYNIEPEQAPDIAMSIYRNYYFYSIEEVALVLRKGSEGEMVSKIDGLFVGKIYDRLSKDIILDWFRIYDSRDRIPFVENARSELDREYRDGQDEVVKLLGGEKNIGRMIEELDKQDQDESAKENNYKAWKEKYFKERKVEGINDKKL